MVDRLLVDLHSTGHVSVSGWLDGEALDAAGESVESGWPLTAAELEELRWYLEDFLEVPFGVYEERGSQAASRLRAWGQAMFTALFGSGQARDAYVKVRARAIRPGSMEIVLRSSEPARLGLPWELLCDPHLPTPLALDGVGLSRSLPTGEPNKPFEVAGERLRVLMVISRPAGANDVGYRMIARPLLRRLEAVRGRVEVEVLRPPTLEALVARLRAAREDGIPFQIVHFDGHGVLTGGPAELSQSSGSVGREGALIFEKDGGGTHLVTAAQIARVLAEAEVPVAVLNACQSGAMGKQLEAAVATRLLSNGVSAVVAMAYSVYAVAAAEFMTAFYEQLFAGETIGEAVRAGRTRMAQRPGRPSPKGELPLEDWAVPVYYWRREIRFPQLLAKPARRRVPLDEALDRVREPEPGERDDPLAPEEEFVGRDGLLLTLEAAARTNRVAVLHGPGGTGKTELAKAFGRWWRETGGVDRPEWVIWHSFEPGVASFGLDGVISEIGLRVHGPDFALNDPNTRRELVHELLCEHRLLLVWDNFESVASMPDPANATPPLDEAGRGALKDFVHRAAAEGRSAILVTSRTPETWLGDVPRISVGGLTYHEAIEYAEELLAPLPATAPQRAGRAFAELLDWLDGHPLSMRLTLPHLENTDPGTLLAGLRGTRPLPADLDGSRTTSLPACISYSLTHLDPTDKTLLTVLSLFHGVADAGMLAVLSAHPQIPTQFRGIGIHDWVAVLDRAAHLGLLTRVTDQPLYGNYPAHYGIHPALPAYLADWWRTKEPTRYLTQRAATERALLDSCTMMGGLDERVGVDRAHRIIDLNRRTLGHLLGYAFDNQLWEQATRIFRPFDAYLDRRGLTEEARSWVNRALRALEGPDAALPDTESSAMGLWLVVSSTQAGRLLRAGDLDAAEAAFTRIMVILKALPESPSQRANAGPLQRRLGETAEIRGHWDEAEQYYRQSLATAEKWSQRDHIADSIGDLGGLAHKRGRWDEAERHYLRSLAMKKELGDRLGMAKSANRLGRLAENRSQLDDAENWYYECLAIAEERHDRDSMARSFHALGTVAHKRRQFDAAEKWYHRCLLIAEERGDRRVMAAVYHQLGTVASSRKHVDEAEKWHTNSLAMAEEVGDRAGMAKSFHMLGLVAYKRRQFGAAEKWYRRALTIMEDLGDQDGIARSCHLLGGLAAQMERLDEAEKWYRQSLAIEENMGHKTGVAASYYQLGMLAEARGQIVNALESMVRSVALLIPFPHLATTTALPQLARLTQTLGMQELERCWERVTGLPLATAVRQFIETHEENDKPTEQE
ncbi:tetratricopeptide repeat protein [Streptomyces sp. NPDC058405]|uniref:tetratricopeptide repeat protein n=1 Tax=unclassified Streptomyces TaxID=2593676 RepID=UPI00364F72DC